MLFFGTSTAARFPYKPLKTNATGGCLAYHTENIKRTNMYGNRSLSSLDVRSFYCQPPSVASYHGSAVCIDTLPIIILQGTVDGSRRRGRPRKSLKDNISGMDRPVYVVIVAHCEQQRLLESHRSRGICWSTPTVPGRHGN